MGSPPLFDPQSLARSLGIGYKDDHDNYLIVAAAAAALEHTVGVDTAENEAGFSSWN